MASKRDIKWAKQICKEYSIKCRFKPLSKNLGGYALSWEGKIVVNSTLKGNHFKSVFLHEVAHCLNYRNKKYYRYHCMLTNTKKNRAYLKRMGLRAEVYTEEQAEILAKKHGVKKYHRFYYFDKISRDFLRSFHGW